MVMSHLGNCWINVPVKEEGECGKLGSGARHGHTCWSRIVANGRWDSGGRLCWPKVGQSGSLPKKWRLLEVPVGTGDSLGVGRGLGRATDITRD